MESEEKVTLGTGLGTSGSASFQEISANVGDTIHADFSWIDAVVFSGDDCASMGIADPGYSHRTYWWADGADCPSGSHTLSFKTDMEGIWRAELSVYDGSKWIDFIATINVAPAVTAGSTSFQETSASVGQMIHADFSWINAIVSSGLDCANMGIADPTGSHRAYWWAKGTDCPAGSHMLECVADMEGIWTAELYVYDGSNWLTFIGTIDVEPAAGICGWIETKGGPSGLTISDVFVIIDSYLFGTPPSGYTFIPTLQNVFGVIDYYLGFDGDAATGCDFFP